MSSFPYTYCLRPTDYQGMMGGIHLSWDPQGKDILDEVSMATGAPIRTMKALTEHFLYRLATQHRVDVVNILAGPHRFTTSSKDSSERKPDFDHISASLDWGKLKAQVYLGNVSDGATMYDNVCVSGIRVDRITSQGKVFASDLSRGTYPNGVAFKNIAWAEQNTMSSNTPGRSTSTGYPPATTMALSGPSTGGQSTPGYMPTEYPGFNSGGRGTTPSYSTHQNPSAGDRATDGYIPIAYEGSGRDGRGTMPDYSTYQNPSSSGPTASSYMHPAYPGSGRDGRRTTSISVTITAPSGRNPQYPAVGGFPERRFSSSTGRWYRRNPNTGESYWE